MAYFAEGGIATIECWRIGRGAFLESQVFALFCVKRLRQLVYLLSQLLTSQFKGLEVLIQATDADMLAKKIKVFVLEKLTSSINSCPSTSAPSNCTFLILDRGYWHRVIRKSAYENRWLPSEQYSASLGTAKILEIVKHRLSCPPRKPLTSISCFWSSHFRWCDLNRFSSSLLRSSSVFPSSAASWRSAKKKKTKRKSIKLHRI